MIEGVATAIFWTSTALVLYVLFGYPLVLAWLARRHSRPIQKRTWFPTVSILLSVRNGEQWIVPKLRSIFALNYPKDLIEVIVVSDGSTDRTVALAREFDGVEVLEIPASGKAVALNTAIQRARREILFFTDVRQELDPDCLSHLVSCLADPSVGVVSGELIIREGTKHEEANTGLYWRYEKWIRRNQSAIDSLVGATGCIYAMRRSLAVPLPPETLIDDVYLPLSALFEGYRIIFEDRARAYDYPTGLQTEFRRKVRTLAGVYQVIGYYPAVLGPGNRVWVHFLSHKLGRLVLPFVLIALALSTLWLPETLSWAALVIQGMVYSLALMDLVLAEDSGLKRLTSALRTFIVLMAASALAISIFFRPSQKLWKPTEAGVKAASNSPS